MLYENLLIKLVDMYPNSIFKFKNNQKTENLYTNIYEPIFIKLEPYFRNYCDTSDFADTLKDIRDILKSNHKAINPVYITRLNKVIDKNGNLKHYDKNEVKQRRQAFYIFAHEFISDYNKIQKSLGIASFSFSQKSAIDQIFSDDIINFFILPAYTFFIIIISSGLYGFTEGLIQML